MNLFDEATLRKLERLTLVAERVRVGALKGDRRSHRRGTSIEFADYREYTRGDDLRRLDWNVLARLGRPFIKLHEEEEDLAVHLLVDTSASMNWPDADTDPTHKLGVSLRLAAALGHIALASGDLLTVTLLQARGDRQWGPFRGRQNSLPLLRFLAAASAGGITDLNHALSHYARRPRRPGLLFVISDLLSPGGIEAGLSALQARGHELGLIHVLSPDELEPPVSGDLKLVDVETGQSAEITLDPATLSLYRQRLQAWQNELAAICHRRRVHYAPMSTDVPWDRWVMQTLRVKGVLK